MEQRFAILVNSDWNWKSKKRSIAMTRVHSLETQALKGKLPWSSLGPVVVVVVQVTEEVES